MRKLIAPILFAAITTSASAQSVELDQVEGTRYPLCNSWSYSSYANGYVCVFTTYATIMDDRDIRDLQQTLQTMQTKIADLERRVTELEARP